MPDPSPNFSPNCAPSPSAMDAVAALRDEIHLTRINEWVKGLIDDGRWPQGRSGVLIITIHNGEVPTIGAIKKQKIEKL